MGSVMNRRSFLCSLTALSVAPAAFCLAPLPDFSGTWKQSNERCVPKRSGEVIRRIDQHGNDLIIETTVLRTSGSPRHAVQRYTLDGRTSVSTGADGDEFHTSIAWNGPSLVFSIEEHEDGRVILSREAWSLIENGSALQVEREISGAPADRAARQTIIYLRLQPNGGQPS